MRGTTILFLCLLCFLWFLPLLAMRFTSYNQATLPNIVVDGSRNEHTVLTLSHWPRSGTPHELKADTSAEIALKYIDSTEFHVRADIVTNNHFDQDGLDGVFVLTDPAAASRYRELLIDVASAGDFGGKNSNENTGPGRRSASAMRRGERLVAAGVVMAAL